MPDILADPPYWLYVLLILAVVFPLLMAVGFGGSASSRKREKKSSPRRRFLIASGVAFLMLLGLFVCDHFFESDKEQIQRKLKDMSDGVHERNLDKVFQHISDSFRVGPADKASLRRLADSAQQNHQVDEVIIWDPVLEPITDGKNATVRFKFKVRGSGFSNEMFFGGKGYFVRDPDNQWRLQKFEVFNPAAESNTPIQVPGL
jgi:hypothetical protein